MTFFGSTTSGAIFGMTFGVTFGVTFGARGFAAGAVVFFDVSTAFLASTAVFAAGVDDA